MKIIAYKVLRATNSDGLEQQVLEALRTGWVLQGGASYGAANYMQAVVRVASDKQEQSRSI